MKRSYLEKIFYTRGLNLVLKDTKPLSFFYRMPKIENLTKVLFVSGNLVEGQVLSNEGQLLFNNLVTAMKLSASEFLLYPIIDDNDEQNFDAKKAEHLSRLKGTIFKYRPKLIISLGADATSVFLGKRERLSKIHGIIYDKKLEQNLESFSFKLMPMFHPEILKVNTAMKEIVWQDIKNLMAKGIF